MRNKKTNTLDLSIFGLRVKECRKDRGITQKQLAADLGVTARYVGKIENKGQHPSLQVFYELATMFALSVDLFFYPEN